MRREPGRSFFCSDLNYLLQKESSLLTCKGCFNNKLTCKWYHLLSGRPSPQPRKSDEGGFDCRAFRPSPALGVWFWALCGTSELCAVTFRTLGGERAHQTLGSVCSMLPTLCIQDLTRVPMWIQTNPVWDYWRASVAKTAVPDRRNATHGT